MCIIGVAVLMTKTTDVGGRHADVRARALRELERFAVLRLDGHFDYGNGYHGQVYLNPHELLRHPSLIWRLAQDLIDLLPASLVDGTEVVAGPVTGGALLAHTIAGLLDGRRSLVHQPCQFAPFTLNRDAELKLRPTYTALLAGKRVLLADDVRNTGKTFERCARLVQQAGGTVIATVEIHDRLEAVGDLGVPNLALAETKEPPNYLADVCPACAAGTPITTF